MFGTKRIQQLEKYVAALIKGRSAAALRHRADMALKDDIIRGLNSRASSAEYKLNAKVSKAAQDARRVQLAHDLVLNGNNAEYALSQAGKIYPEVV